MSTSIAFVGLDCNHFSLMQDRLLYSDFFLDTILLTHPKNIHLRWVKLLVSALYQARSNKFFKSDVSQNLKEFIAVHLV